jgi:xylan 1,4-beta-xylosidase
MTTASRRKFTTAASALLLYAAAGCAIAQSPKDLARQNTYCNPMNLSYRFRLEAPSRREAADPTLIVFHDEYWLFPSKSGGYWHSKDLLHWSFVESSGYDVEDYAPTAIVIKNRIYITTGSSRKLYVTSDPASGKWSEAADFGRSYGDPDLFLDDDHTVYMYYGVSSKEPLHVAELDPDHGFKVKRTTDIPTSRDPSNRGWEVPGDENEQTNKQPYIEGSWVNKHDGTYFLQYAAPGTQFKTYGDGVLIAKNPMGPFAYATNSPFSFKPTGFITGAGHSSTTAGLDGQFWHVASMTISVRHMFERRLGLFPASFTADGELVADTYLGDYPHYISGNRGLVGWMLLSRKKTVTASSVLEGHEAEKAVDENVRTWWSAQTPNPGEWLKIDLGAQKTIQAIQINFADEGSTTLGRSSEGYRYLLESSDDNMKWTPLIDKSKNGEDAPHDYVVLPHAAHARFVRIRNVYSPNGANFSISDLRVFGNGDGKPPVQPLPPQATLDPADGRQATIGWKPVAGAEFYIVRLGTSPKNLSEDYQVYDGATSLDIRSLNRDVTYYITVDAVNQNGVTRGTAITTLSGKQ